MWRVDTTAALSCVKRICGIKFQAGTSATFTIRDKDSNGNILYFVEGSTSVFEEVKLICQEGVHVTVGGTGGVLYIYME
jgi:hypothetical protein